jgi:hypothetical protein
MEHVDSERIAGTYIHTYILVHSSATKSPEAQRKRERERERAAEQRAREREKDRGEKWLAGGRSQTLASCRRH